MLRGKDPRYADYMANVLDGKIDVSGKTVAQAQIVVDKAIEGQLAQMKAFGVRIEGDGGGAGKGSTSNPLLQDPQGSSFGDRLRANPLMQ